VLTLRGMKKNFPTMKRLNFKMAVDNWTDLDRLGQTWTDLDRLGQT